MSLGRLISRPSANGGNVASVGRRRTLHKNLPARMHLKRGRYYYGRNQEFLADNLADAYAVYGEREAARVGKRPKRWKELGELYAVKVIPDKAARTQKDNHRELANLTLVFGEAPLEKIQPTHIRGYLDNRMAMPRKGQKAPERPVPAKVRANREIALFSDIWNWGRDTGATTLPNPCDGITRHKETGRDRYVDNSELAAVWDASCEPLRDALDLHYLTGQRPSDVLRMRLGDIRDGCLWVRQGKTKKPLRVMQDGPLASVLERIQARTYPGKVTSLAMIRDEDGQPLTYDTLYNRFEKAREASGVNFQLRDLRAKAATDLEDLALAQRLLGHTTRAMTEKYVKNRIGEKVQPLLRTGREIADKTKAEK